MGNTEIHKLKLNKEGDWWTFDNGCGHVYYTKNEARGAFPLYMEGEVHRTDGVIMRGKFREGIFFNGDKIGRAHV